MAAQNNLKVPEELLFEAQRIARSEGRSADDLAAEALERYIDARRTKQELEELAKWGQAHARERGFKPSDVERAISEIRRGQ